MQTKTIIIEDLELPEDRCAVLSREAMRQNKPLSLLLKAWLLEKADEIIAASEPAKKAA